MIIKFLGASLILPVLALASVAPSQYKRDMYCSAEWELAGQAASRQLQATEVKLVSLCAPASLRFLRLSLAAIQGSGITQQSLLSPLDIHGPPQIAAANALVERFRTAVPDTAWYQQYWTNFGLKGLTAAEILLKGQVSQLKSVIEDSGEGGISSACSTTCQFFTIAQSLPQGDLPKAEALLDVPAENFEAAVVLLAELGPASLAHSISLTASPWPTDPLTATKRSWQGLVTYLALRAVGDVRYEQIDLTQAIPEVQKYQKNISRIRPFQAGTVDLHHSREGYFTNGFVGR
jgi:hypothetical protein